MSDTRQVEQDEDPVCGMRDDPETARAGGLTLTHDEREYVFCGKGCLLEFRDDPATYLDPRHTPSM
jgi:YHS domain-containing protein